MVPQKGLSPTKKRTNPTKKGTNPTKKGTNPTKKGTNATKNGTNPTKNGTKKKKVLKTSCFGQKKESQKTYREAKARLREAKRPKSGSKTARSGSKKQTSGSKTSSTWTPLGHEVACAPLHFQCVTSTTWPPANMTNWFPDRHMFCHCHIIFFDTQLCSSFVCVRQHGVPLLRVCV